MMISLKALLVTSLQLSFAGASRLSIGANHLKLTMNELVSRPTAILQASNLQPSLPTGGGWHNDLTHKLARGQLGRCIRPDLPATDLTWLEELRQFTQPSVQFSIHDSGFSEANGDWQMIGEHNRRPSFAKIGNRGLKIQYHALDEVWRMSVPHPLQLDRDTLFEVAQSKNSFRLPMSGWTTHKAWRFSPPRLTPSAQMRTSWNLTADGEALQFKVIACGHEAAEGEWIYKGEHNGLPRYTKPNNEKLVIEYSQTRGAWRMYVDNLIGALRSTLYLSHERSDKLMLGPPTSGWIAEEGETPAPKIELVELLAKVEHQRNFPESHSRPLRNTIANWLPHHRAVAYTSNRSIDIPAGMDHPDSHCYEFDYDAPPGSFPDPHGCSLFSRSFSRLKKLRKCVVERLDSSPKWLQYRLVAQMLREKKRGLAIGSTQDFDPELLKVVSDCKKARTCTLLDAYRRVDEMLRYLSFKDWKEVSEPIQLWVANKIRHTVSIYWKDNVGSSSSRFGLEPETVGGIVGDCFGVTAGSYDALPEETKVLERSLVCNAIMWDSAEVPAKPEPPLKNAVSNWDPSLPKKDRATPFLQMKRTPTACGRAAGILAAWPQLHAPFSYSALSIGMSENVAWADCLQPQTFNCVYFEKCWRTALRLTCELTPHDGCCGDVELVSNDKLWRR